MNHEVFAILKHGYTETGHDQKADREHIMVGIGTDDLELMLCT